MLRGIWGDDERYRRDLLVALPRPVLRRRRRQARRGRRPVAARPGRRRHERLGPPDLDHRGRARPGRPPRGGRGGRGGRRRRHHRPGHRGLRHRQGDRRRPSGETGEALVQELRDHVAHEIGPIAKPRQILLTPELPKTRSGKIMRRLLRDVAERPPAGGRHHPDGPDGRQRHQGPHGRRGRGQGVGARPVSRLGGLLGQLRFISKWRAPRRPRPAQAPVPVRSC